MKDYVRDPKNRNRLKNSQFKYKYGITIEEFDKMLAHQKHKCAICETEDPGINKSRHTEFESPAWHVDHDHVSKKVRGILCRNCNIAIGLLNDNPAVAIKASLYLMKNEQGE